MWKCPNCETLNDGDACVVCNEKKTVITQQNIPKFDTVSTTPLTSKSNLKTIACVVLPFILIVGFIIGVIGIMINNSYDSVPVYTTLSDANQQTEKEFENSESDNTPLAVENSKQAISDGVYIIATKLNTDYVLDISGASKDDGANLQLWENDALSSAQKFKVTHVGDGYYQIVNTNSGKAIDAEWGGIDPGTNVWQYEINDTPAQLWKIEPDEDNFYYIINKESELYLDVENANAGCGTNVGLFVRNDMYDAQKWCFIK